MKCSPPSFLPIVLHLVQSLSAFGGVGGVDIEEQNLAPGPANARDDLFDLRHIRAAIKMYAKDVEPAASQLQTGGGPKAAR